MKVSGKSASRAPPPAASATSPSSLSIVAVRSNATGSACTHATFTVPSISASLGSERADDLVLGLVVEPEVLRPPRQDLLPITIPRGLEQPLDLARQRVLPRGRRPVPELALGFRHVDEQRLGRRPGRRPDSAAPAWIGEEDLREPMPYGVADCAQDLHHRRWVGIAAV